MYSYHKPIFNYDLIYICETSLNDSVVLPEHLLNDYTFMLTKIDMVGGLSLFYKNSLWI